MNHNPFLERRSVQTTRRAALAGVASIGAGLLGTVPALGQATPQATPTTATAVGLGVWAGQLATLDPETIGDLLLEREVPRHPYNDNLEAIETDFASDPDTPFPTDALVREVTLGLRDPSDDEIEAGSGVLLVFASVEDAATTMASLYPTGEGETTEASSFAGLPARWYFDHESDHAALYLQAGPVVMAVTDEFLTDGAYTHLTRAVRNVLQNAERVIGHLYRATNDALGLG